MSTRKPFSLHQIIGGRDEQQDAILASRLGPYTLAPHLGPYTVAVIADGMGGHEDGREAALCAAQAFFDYVRDRARQGSQDLRSLPMAALLHANAALKAQAGRGRSGTTLTGILASHRNCAWVHVGDTRLWHLSGGLSRIVTHDMHVPYRRNVLYGSLPLRGGEALPPEHGCFPVALGDRLVLTSDGVHGPYEEEHDAWLNTPGCQTPWADSDRGDGRGLVDAGDAQAVVEAGQAMHKGPERLRDNASAIVVVVQ